MALILGTTSGTGANITSELALGAVYTATADCVVYLSYRLSSLTATAATFTIIARHLAADGTTKIRDFGPYYRVKPTASDTVDGDVTENIPLKSGETLALRVLSSNAGDTAVAWTINVYDAVYHVQAVPRVTLVDTTTTLTEDIAAQIDATAVADAVYNRFAAAAPVVSDSQQYAQRSIVKGNSYSSADRDFIITLANGAEWPTDLSSYSWTYTADIHADNNNTGGSGYASVTGSATVVTATGDTRSIRITLPSTTTGIMAIGFYTHSLRGTASGGRAWTVELGTLEVKADPAV